MIQSLKIRILFVSVSFWLAETALADIKPDLPTMGAGARAFYLTSKSGLAESNDTGLMSSYSLNVYAGSEKSVSVHLEGVNTSIDYALNSAKMNHSELNFLLKVYLGFFYLGAYGGSLQHAVTRADATKIDIFANQYGGSAGMLVNVTKGAYLGTEVRAGIPADLKEATQQDVKVGLKIEGQFYLNFDVTKNLVDLDTGFYYSTQTATFGGAGSGEIQSAPFLGLSFNTDF